MRNYTRKYVELKCILKIDDFQIYERSKWILDKHRQRFNEREVRFLVNDCQDGAPLLPSVPRAIDLRMSDNCIANGGTLLLFMAFYDLSLYIADYVEFFRDLCRAPYAESAVNFALCTLGGE